MREEGINSAFFGSEGNDDGNVEVIQTSLKL